MTDAEPDALCLAPDTKASCAYCDSPVYGSRCPTCGANASPAVQPAAGREEIARIIDPAVFRVMDSGRGLSDVGARQADKAIAKADAILAAISTPAQDSGTGGALADIAAERRRQVEVEGWTPEHDDGHKAQDMALAAACYAAGSTFERSLSPQERRDQRTHAKFSKGIWPWDKRWWKPSDRRRDLVKAGALIVAEIERMDRAALSAPQAAPDHDDMAATIFRNAHLMQDVKAAPGEGEGES